MVGRDAYVLSALSPDEQVSSDQLYQAFEVLRETDRILREQCGLEFRIVNLGGFAFEECKELIRKYGVSSVLSTERIQEELIPRTSDSSAKYLIVQMLRDKLLGLSPTESLLILDNYIFPNNIVSDAGRRDYLQMFEDIFAPVINMVQEITFITRSAYNRDLFVAMKKALLALNPNLAVVCKCTDEFHDRFWILDRSKGLFIGTSLNGIGKRYALVDTIRDDDVKELVKVLRERQLV